MFIQGNYIYWTLLHSRNSRNIYSKIFPNHFMIFISFTITISWIKYSYNFFRLKDEEIVDMIEGSVLESLSVSFLVPSCDEMPPEALPASDTIYLRQNLICPPASRLHLKELLSILQSVSSCSRYSTLFRFGSCFHRQNLPIPKRSPLFTH